MSASEVSTIDSHRSYSTQEDPAVLHEDTPEQHIQRTLTWSALNSKEYTVPRSQRRGFLAQLAIIPEYKDARNYPDSVKFCIVLICAYASVMGPMGTQIVFPAINDVVRDFHTTTNKVNIAVGVYSLSLGIFPLWWASISELHGRRTVYVISFLGLLVFSVGAAVVQNIVQFIVLRVCCGACAASVQALGAASVSDLYVPENRGRMLGIFYLGALLAPLISPIIGASLLTRWSWRSTQWFVAIMTFVSVVFIIGLLPETLRTQDNKEAIAAALNARRGVQKEEASSEDIADDKEIKRIMSRTSIVRNEFEEDHVDATVPTLSRVQTADQSLAERIRANDLQKYHTNIEEEATQTQHRWRHRAYIYFIKPMKAVHFLRYPPVLLAVIFSAVSFGVLYFVNMTIEYCYSRSPYNFRPIFVGLMYVPNSVTYFFASIYGGKWTDRLLRNYKEKYGIIAPEARISYNVLVAIIVYPMSLLIFGWCLDKHQHWVTPLVGTALFGFASMIIIGTTVAYLVDSLPGRGATGVALNNLIRMCFAALATFVTEPVIKGMGVGWMYTMLTFVIILCSASLALLKWKGDHWRETYDLQKLYNAAE